MAAGSGGEGLFAALRGLVATLVAMGRTRLELLGTEIQEEKIRLLDALASGVAALFLFGLGIVLAVACVAAAFWEYRVAIFGICAAVFLACAFYLFSRAKALTSRPTHLFQASLAELDTDLAHLREEMRGRQ